MPFMNSNKNYLSLGLALAALMALTGAALAQQPLTPPAPLAPRPAAKPPVQAPRPAAVDNSAQATPSSPIEVPQQTTATYADWVVQCQTQTGPPLQKVCDMAQVTQVQGKGVPFSRVAIAHPVKGQPAKLLVQVPVNASFAGTVRLQTGDDDPGVAAPFARCLPSGCFADFDVKDDLLKKFRTASGVGKLIFADASGRDVAVPLSFNGFAQAFDALSKE